MALSDREILALCQARDPAAIAAMEAQYGPYCMKVALNILGSHHDAEECVNDAYLAVWNAIPPAQPGSLMAYLAKTTRNTALKRLEHDQARKREGDRFYLLLDELAEVLPGKETLEDEVNARLLISVINDFLKHQCGKMERNLFLRRYFWGDSIGDLTVRFGYSESKTKSQLYRTRQRLRAYLEERGVVE